MELTERMGRLPAWALEQASAIVQQTESETDGRMLYPLPAGRKVRLTCEIAEALVVERTEAAVTMRHEAAEIRAAAHPDGWGKDWPNWSDEAVVGMLEALAHDLDGLGTPIADTASPGRPAGTLADVRDLLRPVEWAGHLGRPDRCPTCGGERPTHTPDCALAAALKGGA